MNKILNPMSWAEADLKAIAYNLEQIRRLVKANSRHKYHKQRPPVPEILAVVKADAYGHGMEAVARLLEKKGVSFFAVSDEREALRLRSFGIRKNILIFRSNLPQCIKPVVHNQFIPTVYTLEFARLLDRYARKAKKRVLVHVKVDSGMGRAGIWHKDAYSFIKKVQECKNLTIHGLYTHFPVADTDKKFTIKQIKMMENLVRQLDKEGLVIPYIHTANSAGLISYRTKIFNMFRPGLMIYGLYPHQNLRNRIHLKPALSVKSKVLFVKNVEKGRNISYGGTFTARKRMQVATIPIGYNDGYPRILSNKAAVLIKGKRCRVLGRVTMDQIIVDVTGLKNVRAADNVVVLGTQNGQSMTADILADLAHTINYEIVCSLGNRLCRVTKY